MKTKGDISGFERFHQSDVLDGVTKPLRDGSRIAVIGAGPAGSMFSYFFLSMAETIGLRAHVDVFEPRRFCHRGPAGCNHCGGVVSESLVQRLATEGIRLPDDVIQRGIDSYTLHMDVGDVEIATPLMEKRIAAIYRGNGPRNSELIDTHSFDGYLLGLAEEKGANLVPRLVTGVLREGDRMVVQCADQSSDRYELVVVASGVNSRFLDLLDEESLEFARPDRTKTFICEFHLGRDVIQEAFGPSMHVFLLDIPRLEFAALIPKGDYVTLCLLGEDIDDELMSRFFGSAKVRNCFPGGVIPDHACHCYPRINIRSARPVFGDRLVLIGDSGTTRLFKDGIGAAYRTAKAAAKTIVFHGVDATSFRKYYAPFCRRISHDNLVGKFVFQIAGLVQKARFVRRGILRMTSNEQKSEGPRRMSGVLWDIFSGSASYTNVFMRTLNPAYIASLAWNLFAGNLPAKSQATAMRQPREDVTPGTDKSGGTSVTASFQRLAWQFERLPPCQAQCPNSGNIRGWLGVIAQHEKNGLTLDQAYDAAWRIIAERNPLPATIGRICPHPCENLCARREKDGAVSINAMERFLGDWALSRSLPLPRIESAGYPESIGVIGSGPASLSFAYQMARRGYAVTMYEQHDRPGGMLRYAIPDYRLPREVLDAEVQRILELNICLASNSDVGSTVELDELRERHKLVFLGLGAQAARELGIPGERGPGVITGIDYLRQCKQHVESMHGKKVLVIGGGNTAIDAARSARRDGAEVVVLYRRSENEMPAIESEVEDARHEGVEFRVLGAPTRIERENGMIRFVEVQAMRLGEPDETGRRQPEPVPGQVQDLPADMVIVAVAQAPDWHGMGAVPGAGPWLRTAADGKLDMDLWAGGDDRGPGIAGGAIAQGRLAAESAHAELRGQPHPPIADNRDLVGSGTVKSDYYREKSRAENPRRPPDECLAHPEAEIDKTLSYEQAREEAARCMSCGLCFDCQHCFMYCNGSGFTRIEQTHPGHYYAMALDACEGCGKCIEVCPCGYLEARDDNAETKCVPPTMASVAGYHASD